MCSVARLRTATGGLILSVFRRADGKLAYYNELTGLTTVGPRISAGAWHELGVHVVVNGDSSLVEVSLDGAVVIRKTAESLGTTPVGRVYIGDPSRGKSFAFAFDNQIVSAPGAPPPPNPTGLAVASATSGTIALTWNAPAANVGVAGYDISLNGTKLGTTTGTSYLFTGLSCGRSYTLGLDAFDAASNSSGIASVIASTGACGTQPPPTVATVPTPTGLTVTATTQSSVSVDWNGSTSSGGVAGYDAFLGTSKVGTTTSSAYTFAGLSCGTTYTFGVDAFDGSGNVSGRASVTTASEPCGGDVFYVSPLGSDSNPGTLARPWRTIERAMASLQPGQTA